MRNNACRARNFLRDLIKPLLRGLKATLGQTCRDVWL